MGFNGRVNSFDVPSATVDELPGTAVLLDVREDDEWTAGHIAEAIHVPMGELPTAMAGATPPIAAGTTVVVVCAVGGRSARVTAWLNQQGFEAINLVGGMHARAQAGRPMVSETGAEPFVA